MLGMPGAALGVAWGHMQETFGVSLDRIGILLGAITIGRLVLSIYSGRMIAWLGLGNFMISGSLLMLASLMGFALVPTWGLLVLSALGYGFGATTLNAGINTHAAAHYESGKMNWLHAWFGLGSALGPLAVTVVTVRFELDWQWAYGLFIVMQMGMIAALVTTRSAWRLSEAPQEETNEPEPSAKIRDSLGLMAGWYGILLFFTHGGIQAGTGQLTETLLTDARGVDPGTAGLWISIYWAGLTIGRLFTGAVVERVGNDRLMRINMFVTIIGTLMLWSNIHNTISFAGIALIGFTLAPVLPVLLADTPKRVGIKHVGNVVGLQLAAAGVGISLLPGIAAFVAERAGLETIGAYLFLIAVWAFATHEGLLIHDRRQRQREVIPQAVPGD